MLAQVSMGGAEKEEHGRGVHGIGGHGGGAGRGEHGSGVCSTGEHGGRVLEEVRMLALPCTPRCYAGAESGCCMPAL